MVFGKIFKKRKPRNEAVIDLAKLNEIQNKERMLKEATLETKEIVNSDVGFLGSLASAADDSGQNKVAVSGQDLEKLERLNRRLDHLTDKFELLERKIERIERRVDLKY